MADKVLKIRVQEDGTAMVPKGGRIVHAYEELPDRPPTLMVIGDSLKELEPRIIKTMVANWAIGPSDVYIATYHSHVGPTLVFEDIQERFDREREAEQKSRRFERRVRGII